MKTSLATPAALAAMLALVGGCLCVGMPTDDDDGARHHRNAGDDQGEDDDHDDDVDDDEGTDDDNDTAPDFGLTWIALDGGEFTMGCSPNDADCEDNENPRHLVTLAPFAITATEVTQAQYLAAMGINPSFFIECDDCPVEQVTWFDAASFCAAAGGRLPTEAEWEYAARGGTNAKFYCGDDAACLAEAAWDLDNADLATHPVAQMAPNAFGLYDMLGNVWEWVSDWYNAEWYTGSPSDNPAGPDAGAERVLRGGAWNNESFYLRVSFRNYDIPTDLSRAGGIRCARDE
jgi:formylglycine-generating enzyme required for sulfatase activity